MKLSRSAVATLALVASLDPAASFSPAARRTIATGRRDVSLSAASPRGEEDRRAFLSSSAAAAALLALGAASPAPPASAKEYAQQWLTEPTQEFLDNEARAAEFRKAQILQKKEFNELLNRIVNVSKTEEDLKKDLEELTILIARTGGLPSGLKKEDVYKQIRSVKARGFWPTSVEYAYQELKLEVQFQQSPNKDKEMGRF